MKEQNIPGIYGIDTRELTKKIREKGSMLGRILRHVPLGSDLGNFQDPNNRNLVAEVSVQVKIFCDLIMKYVKCKCQKIISKQGSDTYYFVC